MIAPDHPEYESGSPDVVNCKPYMVGDLKFQSQMLGKEDFDSVWCYLCNLRHADWQMTGHADREEWTLEKLKEQAKKVKEKGLTDTEMMGVRKDPYFEIPVSQFVWPVLHTLIGIGNKVLKFLVDGADT